MQTSIIAKIDIRRSDQQVQTETPEQTIEFLDCYYQKVHDAISSFGWRLIKTMGDCIFFSAEKNVKPESFAEVFEKVSAIYDITLCYRSCTYVEREIIFGDYHCLDVFGKDINRLFRTDELTVKLG